ncbi:MAG: DMT family transporter [Planctomycetota bacterium]
MIGELAALTAAATWAGSAVLYRRALPSYGARTANLYKTTTGALCFWLTLLLVPGGPASAHWHALPFFCLCLSGVVGLTIGDTLYFQAMQRLGIHRTILLYSLSPVFTLVLGYAFLDEHLGAGKLAGAAIVITGIYLVLNETAPSDRTPSLSAAGTLAAAGAALCQSVGILLAKRGLLDVGALAGSAVRLSVASLALILLTLLRTGGIPRQLLRAAAHRSLLPAMLVGTYVGVFLMLFAIERGDAGIAGVLLATTPIFSLALQVLVDGVWPSLRSGAGSTLAVAGTAILLLGR